jgi:hypothetical protein
MGGMAKIGETIFGSRDQAGILGTGQFRTSTPKIDKKSFEETPEERRRKAELASAMRRLEKYQTPTAQAATIDQAKQAEFRAHQIELAKQLAAQARGEGPSLAALQLQQASDRNIANQMALAASMRGGNPALAQRNLLSNAASLQQQTAMEAAQARMQEQLAAQQQLAGLAASGREADIGLATTQARLAQEAALANQRADIEAQQLRQQAAVTRTGGLLGAAQANRQAMQDYERARADAALGAAGINQRAYSDASESRGKFLGKIGESIGLGSMVSGLLSDEDAKKNKLALNDQSRRVAKSIRDAFISSDKEKKTDIKKADLKDFIKKLTAYQYEYKNPEYGEGQQIGVMAQDLEKSKIGKQAVIDTPEGKMVDYGKLSGAMLANQVLMQEKLDELEKALKRKKG